MPLINPDTLNLSERVIRTNKVQKTNKGGRTMSWNILVVVGDGEGYVGCGVGKARAIPDAIRKGVEAAKRNLIHVPIVGSTIPHEVTSRISAAKVMLKPASPGTGVVAGGSVRALLEAAGVKDILAKSLGSNNPINCAWATMDALRSLKRASDIARLRGKDLSELVSRSQALITTDSEAHDDAIHAGVEGIEHGHEVEESVAEVAPVAEAPVADVVPVAEAPVAEVAGTEAPATDVTTEATTNA